jgi:hypothetical protein
MSHYTPDQWQIVKITGTDPHYRVFGSWSGGYLDGDSWRLNSGITSVSEDDEWFYFYGYTGSVYQCRKESYGVRSAYNAAIIKDYCDKSGGKMEILEDMPEDIMEMDWII